MQKDLEPLVSVIMPAYNAGKYIEDAIKSTIGQTYKNIELIICDDASSDDTVEIIKNFIQIDSRIRLIKNKTNLGISKTLNNCIEKSSGVFIARMDADDLMCENRINAQIQYLLDNNEIKMIGGGIELIDVDGVSVKLRKYPLEDKLIRDKIFYYNPFCHPCLMIRREVFDSVGVYNSKFDGAEDFDMVIRIMEKYKVSNLEDTILKYRIHGNSISGMKSRRQEILTLYIRLKSIVEHNFRISTAAIFYNIGQTISLFLITNKFKRKIFNLFR